MGPGCKGDCDAVLRMWMSWGPQGPRAPGGGQREGAGTGPGKMGGGGWATTGTGLKTKTITVRLTRSPGDGQRHVPMPGAENKPERPKSSVEGCDAVFSDLSGRG